MTADQNGTSLPIRSKNGDDSAFDIVETYYRLLDEDHELTMPMAAIEALIELIGSSETKTVFETIDLVKTQSERLSAAVENPIALSHGTWLFQKYLYSALKSPNPGAKDVDDPSSHEDFEVVRQHLLRNGRVFVERAKAAREAIALKGRKLIRNNTTILAFGGSRVVGTLLSRASKRHDYGHYIDNGRNFKVIYAVDPDLETESNKVIAALRADGIEVAEVHSRAVGYVISKVDMVIVGAEAVTSPGGIISRLGTLGIAMQAKFNNKPFVVAAEQHKYGRTFPVGQFDYTFNQHIVEFTSEHNAKRQHLQMKNPVDHTVSACPVDLLR
jgi:translation initiation factor eIF-2B subunit alpha